MSIPSDFRLSAVPVTDFSYVAEGGANLVVAYAPGPGSSTVLPVLANTVLRVRKTAHGKSHDNPTVSTEEDASVAFTDQVVVPLLPPRSTPRLVSIQLDDIGDWLEQLSQHIEPARPASRRAVDAIDTKRAYVVLADNLVGTANDESIILSVEIKPKWGFLPNPKHLSEGSRPIKTAHCRFCLHKLHKAQLIEQKKHQQQAPADSRDRSAPSTSHVHANHAKATEDYCPLDLYSGDQERVAFAVQALLKSWTVSNGKGNNLKIFQKGEMILPDQHPNFVDNMDMAGQSFASTLTAFLATSPLVKRLAHLQGSLDALDVEGLAGCAKEATGIDLFEHSDENTMVDALGGTVSLDEYTALVAQITDAIDPVLNEKADLRTMVVAYLLSASFKDCSMFVRISRSDKSDAEEGGPLQIDGFLVDVDVKFLARLGRYARLDKELVECFQAHMEAGNAMEPCRL